MNTPQNHHDNCHYPALAVSALRSRTGKTKTHLPSQVEAEAIGKALGKVLMNGGAPQKVWCSNARGHNFTRFLPFSYLVFFSSYGGTPFPQAIVLVLSRSLRVGFSNGSELFFPQLPSLQTSAAKQVFLLLETLLRKDLCMCCLFLRVLKNKKRMLQLACFLSRMYHLLLLRSVLAWECWWYSVRNRCLSPGRCYSRCGLQRAFLSVSLSLFSLSPCAHMNKTVGREK